jgi:hypothetical protein
VLPRMMLLVSVEEAAATSFTTVVDESTKIP